MVGSAIDTFLHFEILHLNELLYFTCGSKFIKENPVFANTLADKHWNCGIDHRRWATQISLHLGLTCLQVAFKDLCDQSCLPIPLILPRSGSVKIGGSTLDATFCHTVKQRPDRCHSRATTDADYVAVRPLAQHEDAVRSFHHQFLAHTDTALQQTRKPTTGEDLDHE